MAEPLTDSTKIAPSLPGQSGRKVPSDDATTPLASDISHVAPVHLASPEIGNDFGTKTGIARATRNALLARAARDVTQVRSSHIAVAEAGQIMRAEAVYRSPTLPDAPDS